MTTTTTVRETKNAECADSSLTTRIAEKIVEITKPDLAASYASDVKMCEESFGGVANLGDLRVPNRNMCVRMKEVAARLVLFALGEPMLLSRGARTGDKVQTEEVHKP